MVPEMGYTNRYHFEKRLAPHPDPERCGPYYPDRRRVPRLCRPKGLGSGSGEGRLYYVFRDPLSVEDGHDVIGLSFSEARARSKAERYVETHGCRALVGRLLETMTWH